MKQLQEKKDFKIYGNCNGCGQCCKTEICEPGQLVFSSGAAPCPALTFVNNRYLCLLIAVEIDNGMAPILQKGLGVGKGCTNEEKIQGIERRPKP